MIHTLMYIHNTSEMNTQKWIDIQRRDSEIEKKRKKKRKEKRKKKEGRKEGREEGRYCSIHNLKALVRIPDVCQ